MPRNSSFSEKKLSASSMSRVGANFSTTRYVAGPVMFEARTARGVVLVG